MENGKQICMHCFEYLSERNTSKVKDLTIRKLSKSEKKARESESKLLKYEWNKIIYNKY